jgi:Glu-tRNA(Gln) amidotransferase subunit E-like FAD-binding protein
MYPDTDTPPLALPDEWRDRIRVSLPERPWERAERLQAKGLDAAAAQRLSAAAWAGLFEELSIADEATAATVEAAMQKRLPARLRAQGCLPEAGRLQPWVDAIAENRLRPEAVETALDRICVEPLLSPEDVLASLQPHDGDARALEALLRRAVENAPRLRRRDEGAVLRWAMGQVMPPLLGRIPPDEVLDRLRDVLADRLEEVAS